MVSSVLGLGLAYGGRANPRGIGVPASGVVPAGVCRVALGSGFNARAFFDFSFFTAFPSITKGFAV